MLFLIFLMLSMFSSTVLQYSACGISCGIDLKKQNAFCHNHGNPGAIWFDLENLSGLTLDYKTGESSFSDMKFFFKNQQMMVLQARCEGYSDGEKLHELTMGFTNVSSNWIELQN